MKVSHLARKMIQTIIILSTISILISIIYYRSLHFLPFLFGCLIGTLVSIIKVFMLDHAVDKALNMEKKSAGNYLGFQHLLRLGLTAGALLIGALVARISLWGVVAGIFVYQLAVYNAKFSNKIND